MLRTAFVEDALSKHKCTVTIKFQRRINLCRRRRTLWMAIHKHRGWKFLNNSKLHSSVFKSCAKENVFLMNGRSERAKQPCKICSSSVNGWAKDLSAVCASLFFTSSRWPAFLIICHYSWWKLCLHIRFGNKTVTVSENLRNCQMQRKTRQARSLSNWDGVGHHKFFPTTTNCQSAVLHMWCSVYEKMSWEMAK
jgi:hypothetical protein